MLILLAVLAVGGHALVHDIARDGHAYADAIDVAGRQQLLSQQTILLGYRLARAPTSSARAAIAAELETRLARMAEAQRDLARGDPTTGLPRAPTRVRKLAATSVDPLVAQHVAMLRRLAPELAAGAPAALARLDAWQAQVEHVLLPELAGIVAAYRDAATAGSRRHLIVGSSLLAGLLVSVALISSSILRPMGRRMERSVRQLEAAYGTMRRLTLEDALTGVGNRVALGEALSVAPGARLAALQIDLDHFKSVNDLLGHDMGDSVLCAAAQAIAGVTGGDGRVFRLGGDEFLVLLVNDVDPGRSVRTAERVIAAIDAQCPADAVAAGLAASIGVALYPDDDAELSHLLANADIALLEAKTLGRHRCCRFRPGMRAPIETRHKIQAALRHALDVEALTLHFQPQLDLESGALVGLEGLARWRTPEGDVLGADRFIPFIEDSPLILEASARLLEVALAFQRGLVAEGLPLVPIGLNVADLQLRDGRFADTLLGRLEAAGLGPAAISIEVVERLFVGRGQDLVSAQLERLAAAGVTIELDDFGTGHASLTHLKTFPVHRIKIDKSFVAGIGRDPGDETIVRATIEIAQSFRRRVVAEGVETETQRRFLLDHGCAEGQGYLIAPPLPAPAAMRWMRGHRARLTETAQPVD